jgi:FkbM family methyltransferase
LMLPTPNDWRWLEGRDDSPWYPTMRLFRQSRASDWSDVIARVADALRERVGNDQHNLADESGTNGRPPADAPLLPCVTPVPPRGPLSMATHTRVGTLQYWPEQHPVGPSISYYGEYLQPQLDLLGRMIRPGVTAMEVGTGIGVHAVFLGKAIGPAGHLFAYEPRPMMQAVMRQNLSSNGIGNFTIMRNAAGGPRQSDPDANEISGTPKSNGSAPSHDSAVEAIDELQLERLHWLKINEHNNPLEVLRGAVATLWRLRPLLFAAALDERTLLELATIGRECSYRTWRMDTLLFNPSNFNRRDHNMFPDEMARALLAVPEEIDMDIVLDGCVELP